MKDEDKTKEQLISELMELRQRVAELEALEAERRAAEEQLRESEERIHTIVSNAPVVIWALDKEGIFTLSEGAGLKSLGLRPGEVVGQSVFDVYRDVPKILEDNRRALSGETIVSTVEVGELVYESHYSPVRNKNREIIGMVGVSTDITERKQAEQALRESEGKYRALVEEAPVGIMNVDIKGKITYVNKTVLQSTGYLREELVGKNAFRLGLVSRETIGVLVRRMKEKLAGKLPSPLEIQFKCKDGKWIWLEIRGKALREHGMPVGIQIIGENITERKRAEEALRQSERRFRDIAENALEWIWEVDVNGEYTYASPVCEKILGYKPEELLGKHFYDLFVPEEREQLKKAALETFAKKQPFCDFINQNMNKNGEIVWLCTSGVPILDERGNLLGYRGADTDITERKQAREALESAEQNFRNSLDNSPLGIRIIDIKTEGETIYANQAILGIYGYGSIEEFKSIPAVERHTPKSYAERQERVRKRKAGEPVPDHFEQSIIRKDGEVRNLEVFNREVLWGGEKQFQVIYHDITERKRVEEEVRWLAKFPSQNPNPVLRVAKDGTIHFANQAGLPLLNMWGCQVSQLIPEYWHKFILDALSSGSSKGTEIECGERVLSLTFAPVVDMGCVNLYGLDITERKRAEEREKELQKELSLASRLASVGELAAGVAHEINNPLTGILAFSERLLRKSTDGKVSRDLKRINNEAGRAAKVIERLLTFARRRELKKENSDVNYILRRALELRAYELKTSNIKVELGLAVGLPKVMVDSHQFQEVFLSIIMNAEQAMTEAVHGGKLSIKTQGMKNCIRISFTDDGPGISAEHLDRVFDPFFTTRGKGGGTGLGLSVCHGIVQRHDGKIYAKSKPGKGTTLIVDLPLTSEKVEEAKRS